MRTPIASSRLFLASASTFTVVLGLSAPAHADVRVSIAGSARLHIGGSIGVGVRVPHVRWHRPRLPHRVVSVYPAPSYYVGGYYSYQYAAPPPPPPACDCPPAPVPAYYSASAATTVEAPPTPSWGLGVFAGAIDVDGQTEGSDFGLLARYRLTPAFHLEAEVGQSRLAAGERLDRRLGGGVAWELWASNHLAPYLTAGAGVSQAEVGGDWTTQQNFAELGVGLRWRLSPRLDLTADVRGGSRMSVDEKAAPTDMAARRIAPDTTHSEDYARGRIAAMINF